MSLGVDLKNNFQNKKALIIVESPLQLLCAYEAIYYFKLEYSLYIILTENELNNLQIKNMVVKLKLRKTNYLRITAKKNIFNILSIIGYYVQFRLKHYSIYIIGDYFSRKLNIFTFFIDKNKILLLDDGVATFKIQKELKKQNIPISLYTMFQIEAFSNQKIFYNNFMCLKCKFQTKTSKNTVVFIGAKLVDLKILDISTYINIIKKALSSSQGDEFLYFPHRGTSEKNLKEVSNIKGLDIIDIETTLEFHLLSNSIKPIEIYSIVSTALFSLSSIFEDSNVVAYKPKFLASDRQQDIENVYKEMENTNRINIVTIGEI